MEIVLDIILPVFGVVILGYGVTKVGWFKKDAEAGLASFVFNFAVPMMLFRSLATADLPAEVPLAYFSSFYISGFSVAILGFFLARFMFGRSFGGQVITAFGNCFGNTVLLGLPLIMTTFGEKAALPFFIILSVHGLIFFTLATLLLEFGHAAGGQSGRDLWKQTLKSLVTNPVLLGIYLGLTVNLSGLTLPGPIESICALMQKAVTPCALFALGASLTKYGFAGRLGQSSIMVISKLIIMPAMVFGLATYIFEIDPFWTMVAVLMAAQPSGVMTYIFATKYNVGQAIATTSIFMSTTLSMVTLSVILFLFDVR